MKLIVGLGNFGSEYNNTRHNIGFSILDSVVKGFGLSFDNEKFNGKYTSVFINGEKIYFLKPLKYMNLSGEVIKDFMNYFDIKIEEVLIIYDDMDTEFGFFKLRIKGGSAGHNGLKNIEMHLKTKYYKRLKVGISRPVGDKISYVLGKFNKKELEILQTICNDMNFLISDFLNMSFENLMNKYN